jgi:DNA-binding transcriptional regulator YdaS (Cro superfamily)
MQEKCRIALLRACRIVGGQKELAARIKVNPSRLNKWITRHKGSLPFQCAIDIEKATSGQVTCAELVPKWEKVVAHFICNGDTAWKR